MYMSQESTGAGETPKKNEFLREQEVADFLDVRVRTVQGWRQKGQGPKFVKFGKTVRYPRRELEEFAATPRRQSTKD
jgi:predicted DNA-binding transcriptional regulator AlpA